MCELIDVQLYPAFKVWSTGDVLFKEDVMLRENTSGTEYKGKDTETYAIILFFIYIDLLRL